MLCIFFCLVSGEASGPKERKNGKRMKWIYIFLPLVFYFYVYVSKKKKKRREAKAERKGKEKFTRNLCPTFYYTKSSPRQDELNENLQSICIWKIFKSINDDNNRWLWFAMPVTIEQLSGFSENFLKKMIKFLACIWAYERMLQSSPESNMRVICRDFKSIPKLNKLILQRSQKAVFLNKE